MIPTRHFMELKGKHAVIRMPAGELEFYYRIKVDEAEPDVELMHAQPKGDMRVLETINTNIVGENDEKRKTVAIAAMEGGRRSVSISRLPGRWSRANTR